MNDVFILDVIMINYLVWIFWGSLLVLWIGLSLILYRKWGKPYLEYIPIFIGLILLLTPVIGLVLIKVGGVDLLKVSFSPVWLIFPVLFIFKRNEFISIWSDRKDLHPEGWVLGLGLGLLAVWVWRNPNPTLTVDATWPSLIHIVIYTIQHAFAEEVIFRWWLINYLQKFELPRNIIVVLQAILFSLGHTQYYTDYMGMIIVVFWGFISGWIVLKQKNIAATSIAHAILNLICVILVVFFSS